MSAEGLTACLEKMRREGLADAAVETFRHYYEQLEAGETGLMAEAEIEPVDSLPDADELTEAAEPDLLDRTVVIKLNGGLGTSMGMTGPKSLLEVKDGLTFLDVIARQVLRLRERTGARLPLVLMNSFATREPSLEALSRHEGIEVDVPTDFLQNKEPKVRADDLMPVEWPADPALEWCPPGHGDLYTALQSSGTLERLLDQGYRYAFVSNVDNLGAVLDERILAWFAASGAPFAMEAADRTEADRKGGHVARRRDGGGLVLREIAQTPDEDVDAFQDVARHRYFNTNNLWLDLQALADVLARRGSVLGLPMIVNRKTVDPADKATPAVLQLETAMGSAIGVFDGALALRVPRRRLAPVKTTSDLLVLRSDAYELTGDFHLDLAAARSGRAPIVVLDDGFKLVRDFDARFPHGPPSL
ncbi:MAG TPA: UTP--glucose-1-phosphate uridylyltransferase, partial [Solirubrobacteraceae bacterium]|nr:UTP--glucose-1-phosphate uridylyltransferase [Solirubrobacteraceae bacterium]